MKKGKANWICNSKTEFPLYTFKNVWGRMAVSDAQILATVSRIPYLHCGEAPSASAQQAPKQKQSLK